MLYNGQQNPCSKNIETTLSTFHSSTAQLLFPAHTSHTSNLWCPTFPTDTAKRWPLIMSHSNWLAHKEAGRDSSFKYFSHHHLRPKGLWLPQLLMSQPTWLYQGAAFMLPFIKRQVLATMHLERVQKREVGYHWSYSRFNSSVKWDLCSVKMYLTTRWGHNRSWKYKMEVYQTHSGLF